MSESSVISNGLAAGNYGDVLVSTWRGVEDVECPVRNVSLQKLAGSYRGIWAIEPTSSIRRDFTAAGGGDAGKQAIRKLKEGLSCVTFSGTFSRRDDESLEVYSRIVLLDYDHIGADHVEALKQKISGCPHVVLCMVSPSGAGLKVGVAHTGGSARHKDAVWQAVEVLKALGAPDIDKGATALSQACYDTYDPELYFNPHAVPMDLPMVLANSPAPAFAIPPKDSVARVPEEDVRGALAVLDPDARYIDWVRVGFALHDWDLERGRDLWTEWSSRGAKFIPGECAKKWESFGTRSPDDRSPPVKIATLFFMAQESKSKRCLSAHPSTGAKADATKPANHGGTKPIIELPGGETQIIDCAVDLYTRLKDHGVVFRHNGEVCELLSSPETLSLHPVKPDGLRSLAEKVGRLMRWGKDGNGKEILRPTTMPVDTARALLACREAVELLPPVASVLQSPVLIEDASGQPRVLGRGYHPAKGGILVLRKEAPPLVPLDEAVTGLKVLIEEFEFLTPSDFSRALASFLTPALRFGGIISDNIPIFVAEANEPQSGKGESQAMVCAVYDEPVRTVTQRKGGVGSFEESLGTELAAGHPFICIDNVRGRLDSPFVEAFLTCQGLFSVRLPYRQTVMVDPKRFILQLTANGIEVTRDLGERVCIWRIRKRRGFAYRDTLELLKASQAYFLGCVFSVLSEWIRRGKPRTNETRHSFRNWAQPLDWIVQHLCGCAPLLDGHLDAQSRASNPAMCWLRKAALAVEEANKLGMPLIATDIANLGVITEDAVLGCVEAGTAPNRQHVGVIMSGCFGTKHVLEVEEFTIRRYSVQEARSAGGASASKRYTITRTTRAP